MSFSNVAIDVARPAYLLSPINGMFKNHLSQYPLHCTSGLIKVKSRVFVLVLQVPYCINNLSMGNFPSNHGIRVSSYLSI